MTLMYMYLTINNTLILILHHLCYLVNLSLMRNQRLHLVVFLLLITKRGIDLLAADESLPTITILLLC